MYFAVAGAVAAFFITVVSIHYRIQDMLRVHALASGAGCTTPTGVLILSSAETRQCRTTFLGTLGVMVFVLAIYIGWKLGGTWPQIALVSISSLLVASASFWIISRFLGNWAIPPMDAVSAKKSLHRKLAFTALGTWTFFSSVIGALEHLT